MPDWLAYVNGHLGRLPLSETESSQVREELAAHLEDAYLSLLAQGFSETNAARLVCDQVPSWQQLHRDILAAKSEAFMQNRVSQLWVPGLVTLTGSAALLAVFEFAGWRPMVIPPHGPYSFVIYFPWLFCLPLFGALGAYLSLRARAHGLAVHCAALFPALVMAASLFAILLVALVLTDRRPLGVVAAGFGVFMLNWFLLPGFFLLLGDLLLQLVMKRRLASN